MVVYIQKQNNQPSEALKGAPGKCIEFKLFGRSRHTNFDKLLENLCLESAPIRLSGACIPAEYKCMHCGNKIMDSFDHDSPSPFLYS